MRSDRERLVDILEAIEKLTVTFHAVDRHLRPMKCFRFGLSADIQQLNMHSYLHNLNPRVFLKAPSPHFSAGKG